MDVLATIPGALVLTRICQLLVLVYAQASVSHPQITGKRLCRRGNLPDKNSHLACIWLASWRKCKKMKCLCFSATKSPVLDAADLCNLWHDYGISQSVRKDDGVDSSLVGFEPKPVGVLLRKPLLGLDKWRSYLRGTNVGTIRMQAVPLCTSAASALANSSLAGKT
ncbi:hypothetical protein F5B19DRAFT_334798 [Rostrohypoxylon terebratum]|nr:hypothetical protein F5B19DRAFT_334798 [Rostrohypoxylon terebratum]